MRLVEDRQVEGGEIDELGLEGTVLGREFMEPLPDAETEPARTRAADERMKLE